MRKLIKIISIEIKLYDLLCYLYLYNNLLRNYLPHELFLLYHYFEKLKTDQKNLLKFIKVDKIVKHFSKFVSCNILNIYNIHVYDNITIYFFVISHFIFVLF